MPFLAFGGLVATVIAIVARDYPWVGHDYRYFIPRLIDTDLHLRINGLAIQWFTPTFGGGLPAFPNPQHLQYSFIQAATLLVNPWLAVLLTTGLVIFTGCFALYRFSRSTLNLSPVAATLGALFFTGNGFFIEHLIVGHLGFQLFPLGAVMLAVLTDTRRLTIVNGAAFALVVAVMLHQAGFYLLIILGLSIALTLPLLACYQPSLLNWRRIISTSGVALALAIGMTGSKIYAALSLMRHFPREAADVYHVGLAQAIAGLIAQLTGAMVLAPLFAAAGMEPARVSGALMKLTGADGRTGVWETDTGLSPVLLVVLLAGLVRLALDRRANGWPTWHGSQKRALVAGAVLAWIAIEATLARGLIYPWLKQLPVISSLHVNHRLAAAFILPLSIVGAMLVDRWQSRRPRPALGWAMVVLSVVAPTSYFLLPAQVHLRTFDITRSIDASRLARGGDHFEVTAIVTADDAEALMAGGSSLQPYEPLFGYINETFTPQIHAGDIHDVRDGFFNMTNPASLVFPESNGLQPFDRIAVADRDQLDLFAGRRQPAWQRPAAEGWLNLGAMISLAIAVAALALHFASRTPSVRR